MQVGLDFFGYEICTEDSAIVSEAERKFTNCGLESTKQNPDEWIMELEGLMNDMTEIAISANMNGIDFMIHTLNNLLELYGVVLVGMESRLMLTDTHLTKLKIEDMQDKLNSCFVRINIRELEHKIQNAERALVAQPQNYMDFVLDVAKTVTKARIVGAVMDFKERAFTVHTWVT